MERKGRTKGPPGQPNLGVDHRRQNKSAAAVYTGWIIAGRHKKSETLTGEAGY
jgi:hypothetical protein